MNLKASGLDLNVYEYRHRDEGAANGLIENHEHSFAITMMFHNFCRIHKTLRVTSAMEAGLTDHVWEITEVVALLD